MKQQNFSNGLPPVIGRPSKRGNASKRVSPTLPSFTSVKPTSNDWLFGTHQTDAVQEQPRRAQAAAKAHARRRVIETVLTIVVIFCGLAINGAILQHEEQLKLQEQQLLRR